MRVGIVSIQHESLTFMPEPTTLRNFEVDTLKVGPAVAEAYGQSFHEVGGFFRGLEEDGIEPVPLFMALAVASGTISDDTASALLRLLDEQLDAAGDLDGLLLAPHGAAVSASEPDFDGHWLSYLRQRLGWRIPFVCTFDPHANVSPRMIEACNATIAYKTNPHLDQLETGLVAAKIMARTLRGDINPVQALAIPRVAISIDKQETGAEPCLGLYRLAETIAREPGVLSTSIALGFPYADVPQLGSSMWVVTDGDEALAQTKAQALADYLVAHRREFAHGLTEIQDAVKDAKSTTDRLCLLDVGDNAGGGAPADSTVLVRALHEANVPGVLVLLHDPESAAQARHAGVGATLSLRMGGKDRLSPAPPLEAGVTVLSLHDGYFTDPIPSHAGRTEYQMGPTAVVRTDRGMTVMLFSLRIPPYSLQQVLSCGLDPRSFRVIVAKGVNAPLGAYRPVCDRFVRVNTPGITCADMTSLTYHQRGRPLYPFEDEPAAAPASGAAC